MAISQFPNLVQLGHLLKTSLTLGPFPPGNVHLLVLQRYDLFTGYNSSRPSLSLNWPKPSLKSEDQSSWQLQNYQNKPGPSQLPSSVISQEEKSLVIHCPLGCHLTPLWPYSHVIHGPTFPSIPDSSICLPEFPLSFYGWQDAIHFQPVL